MGNYKLKVQRVQKFIIEAEIQVFHILFIIQKDYANKCE